jgi:secondary thiamine-phosphate synthase enzyme
MIELTVKTSSRNQMVDVTSKLAERIPPELSGIATICVPHTTAGITINEGADPAVKSDIMNYLQKLVPHSDSYTHLEGNSDAHIKSALVGNSATVIVENGRLLLGTWQAVYLCEFDGPRNRKIYLELLTK